MGIDVGTRIGTYRITSLIGKGGMGAVYRATDERLKRDVAIKVLNVAGTDRSFTDRFEREARLLASINHPHIGAIYGVEDVEGSQALVLELIEGQTLAARLRDGALAPPIAIEYARQIADALAAAHAKGIIHRDLKPSNIIVNANGHIKVLDFGLAKSITASPDDGVTRTATLTQEGTVMGTAGYMSPEQARGLKVDEQVDIWAFGCVLFEMLSGRRPFQGQTTSDAIAAILKSDPDWKTIPVATPSHVLRVVRRCLEKDPTRRYHSIADVRLDLEEQSPEAASAVASRWNGKYVVAAAIVIAIAAGVATSVLLQRKPNPLLVTRFAIATVGDDYVDGSGVAISPDGNAVAYVSLASGSRRLAIRRLDEIESKQLPGTEGAVQPFFSPDGQWIGFFAGGKLRKIPFAGGTSEIVTDAANSRGGTWGPDDTIIFAPQPSGPLMRVAASGGTATPITQLGPRESSHRYPQFLPGGKAIIYAAGPPGTVTLWSEASIIAESLVEPRKRTVISQRGSTPRYLSSGHVAYIHQTQMFAVPIDVATIETTGQAIQLDDHVAQVGSGFAQFDVAPGGMLASVPSSYIPSGELALVDRTGGATSLGVRVPFQSEMRVSPDGSKVAYTGAAPDAEVWIYDFQQRTTRQLTTGGGNVWPVWSPDGKRVAYGSFRYGVLTPFVRDAGGGPERELAREGGPLQWLPDGSALAIGLLLSITRQDQNLALLGEGATAAHPMPGVQPRDASANFSPDGKLVATMSSETGRTEVVVCSYPGPGERVQVSKDGGAEPVFSRDGRSLFYRHGLEMMIVDVTPGAVPRFSAPRVLFNGTSFSGFAANRANFDVMPDGRHFVMIKLDQSRPTSRLVVTQNWQDSIRAKLRR